MGGAELSARVKEFARDAGFELCGIAPVRNFSELNVFPSWIADGRHGEMKYMEARNEAGDLKRANLRNVAPWARSVIVCAINYNTAQPYSTQVDAAENSGTGWISRYAWCREDYHDAVIRRLRMVEACLHEALARRDVERADDSRPTPADQLQTRAYVDTGPLVERVYAKYAGVGWIGKNTCIINQKLGSWLFLGVILTSVEITDGAGRRSSRPRSLRHLHALHHCLSDPGHCCARRTGWAFVHFISHNRKARRDSRGTTRWHGASCLWLRHLPGRLPLESQGASYGGG